MAVGLPWRWSIPSRVFLVFLGPGRVGSAQGVPFEPEVGLERTGPLESGSLAFEGIVYEPSGAPAEGAVVVSSAGGQAVTGWNGTYRLETRMPPEADIVEITAVGRTG